MTKKNLKWFILGATSALTLTFLGSLSVQAQESDTTLRTQARDVLRQSLQAEQKQEFQSAIEKMDEAMKLGFTQPIAHYKKGCWNFRLGKIDESMKEFDRYVELEPARANSQWERGITCYYARKYKAGAQQFVDYQSFHDNDVENAVWRYLCQMKFDGKEKARKAILPIKADPRIPMMEIYRLFRSESTPAQVMKVLEASPSMGLRSQHEKFDAHLYLALYFDSEGKLDEAKKQIDFSVKQFKAGDYMWAVAVEHQKHVDEQIAERSSPKTSSSLGKAE